MTISVKMLMSRQGPGGITYAVGSSYDVPDNLAHNFVSTNAATYTAGAMPINNGGVPIMGELNHVTGEVEVSAGEALIVIADAAPDDNDGRPVGTLYFQRQP